MGKAIIPILIILMLIPIALASEYEYKYNPYTGKLDRTRSMNQTGMNTTLGPTDVYGNFTVFNETGNHVFVVDTDNSKVNIWNKNEGAGDYVSVYHDGTYGKIASASGELRLNTGTYDRWAVGTDGMLYPIYANYDIGKTTKEIRSVYLGNSSTSGAYFGLGQENHLWAEDSTLKLSTNQLQVWDDALGANDYVSIYHDGSNAAILPASGSLYLGNAGAFRFILESTTMRPNSINTYDMGSTSNEYRGLYLGEDISSGVYFGLDQDWRIWNNGTSNDLSIHGANNVVISETTNIIPSSKLDIRSGTSSGSDTEGTGALTLGSDLGYWTFRGTATPLQDLAIDRLYAGTDYEVMRIQRATGNVGIGTTSPGMALHVGGGSSSHSLTNSQNDTYITGKLEVDGTTYFDGVTYLFGDTYISDNIRFIFGAGTDSHLDWSTAQATENTLVWGLGDTAKSIIFSDKTDANQDFDHPAQANPTLFMHSNTDPDTNNTQWGSIAHDTSSFVIDSGTDSIILDDTTTVSGDLELGDEQVGAEVGDFYYNGTQTILEMKSPDGTYFICSVNNSGNFICS